jgi:hypothetical protein
MSQESVYKHLISSLYKMLCWREEKKRWQTIYDEMLAEISLGQFDEDFKAQMLLKIVPLKYYDFSIFRQTIFEVIDYVDNISRIQK